MASFKDTIPQFNPYVSQQPVESMVKVGMMKQEKYDTNLEKISQSMANVAGLDLRDVDKEYLNKKMTEMSSQLRGYAAGDFSKTNITRQVNGMVNSVAGDPLIKQGVSSMAKARTEMGRAQKAQDEGESSIINQSYLDSQLQEWINNPKVGAKFTGEYIPFKDVDDKLRKLHKDMEAIDVTVQNPFVRGANGNVLYFDKDNNVSTTPKEGYSPKYDTVMTTETVKGISSKRIYDNFLAGLDADDLRQLQLNSWYHYKDTPVEKFEGLVKNSIKEEVDFKKQAIVDLNVELRTNPNLSQEQKIEIEKALTQLHSDTEESSVNKKLEENLAILKDPNSLESFKNNLYRENYLRDLSTALATESRTTKIESNPGWNAEFKMKEFSWRQRTWAADYAYRSERDRISDMQWEASFMKDKLTDNEGLIVTSAPKSQEEFDYSLEDYANQIVADQESIDNLTTIFLNKAFGGEIDEETLERLYDEYKVNPSKIGDNVKNKAELLEYIQRRRPLEIEMQLKQNIIESAKTLPQVRALEEARDVALTGMENIVNPELGVNFTPQEVLEFGETLKTIWWDNVRKSPSDEKRSGERGMPIRLEDTFDLKNIPNITNPKTLAQLKQKYQGTKFEQLANAIITRGEAHNKGLPGHRNYSPYSELYNDFVDLYDDAHKVTKESRRRIDGFQREYIRENSPFAKEQTTVISPKRNENLYNRTKEFVTAMKSNKALMGAIDVYTEDELATFDVLAGAKDTEYIVSKDYYGNAKLTLLGPEGEKVDLNIPQEHLIKYLPEVTVTSPLNAVLNAVASSPRNTSNLAPPNVKESGVSAFLTGAAAPRLVGTGYEDSVRFDIKGSFTNTGDITTDKYLLKIWYNEFNGNWVEQTTDKYVPYNVILQQLESFDLDTLLDIYKSNIK